MIVGLEGRIMLLKALNGKSYLVLVLAFTISISGLTQSSDAKVIPNAYIVQVTRTADVNDVAGKAAGFTGGSIGHVYSKALRGFSIRVPPGITKAQILAQPGVVLVEPDLEVTVCAQTLPTGVNRIDVDLNKTAKIDGIDERVDVDIAIIDTGIDIDHPDLYVVGGRHFYTVSTGPPGQRSRQDDNYDDDYGHGSHVAGIAAALDNDIGVVGVAPGARLWAVKVFTNGSGQLSDVIAGVDWVTGKATQIEVVNMSLSAGGTNSIFRTAIQNSVAAGIVYVVAAGNDAKDVYGDDGTFNTSDDFIPAAYPEVATISAMADSDGQPGGAGGSTGYGSDDSFATLSNFSRSVVAGNPVTSSGRAIDLLMPGVNIYSTNMGGGYTTKSGTSMASPHAAGLAALYIAINGRATNAAGVYAIRQALIDSGVAQDSARGLAQLNDPDANWENIGWAGTEPVPDTDPPTPNPMTWATLPYATGTTSIAMVATTAFDSSGVEYYFTCTAGSGHDSGWQASTSYEDTGLTPDTQYAYTVTARDKSINQNATTPSTAESATTLGTYTISGYIKEPDGNTPVVDVLVDANNNGGSSDITDSNGYYEAMVPSNWSGKVTPIKEGCTFEPNSSVYTNVTQDYYDVNYVATLTIFIISGYVAESNDGITPISDVNVSAENGGGPDTTDANGYYKVVVDYNWSGKVTPTKDVYSFEPNSRAYTNVIADQNNQDYAGKLLTFAISGYIRNDCNVPIKGIVMTATNGGSSTVTDANGHYEVWVDCNWSGTVTPSKAYYTFAPTAVDYTAVLEDKINQDYLATNIYDLNCNGSIDFWDVQVISVNWLDDTIGNICDFNADAIVNFNDFAELANVWATEHEE